MLNLRVRCRLLFVLFSFPYPEVVCVFSSSGLFLVFQILTFSGGMTGCIGMLLK